ncbi:VOC family protein [Microlunatus parietis]|uniref:Catechol 2,3-dioxygenase-like lactoylglutathione lyase family enzyme n=1 Tax=Microlunatus parietis TaxID=682979 RepID=A0A7Y9I792_9ACTN|nr:VOC family protein [Microlunatus parietis]NYE71350.1 catechol 2,3-dioxygenase-like lactoylglutathione lyase family enzyme [Microlunatus parietis]
MTSRISHTSIDARDAYAQSVWWADVLGFTEDPDDPNAPDHDECLIMSADRSVQVLFIEVPEAKSVKNRIHFDLRPIDRTQAEEIERVLALGATEVADLRRPDGSGWMVLADPEGNEFCILLSDAEREAYLATHAAS